MTTDDERWAALYADVPTAFWLNPHLWSEPEAAADERPGMVQNADGTWRKKRSAAEITARRRKTGKRTRDEDELPPELLNPPRMQPGDEPKPVMHGRPRVEGVPVYPTSNDYGAVLWPLVVLGMVDGE